MMDYEGFDSNGTMNAYDYMKDNSVIVKDAPTRRQRSRAESKKESVLVFEVKRPFSRKRTRLWIVLDCCGIACTLFTWALLSYAQFVVFYVLLLPAQSWSYKLANGVLFESMFALCFLSHLRSMLTDPGSIPLGNATVENIRQMGFTEGQIIFKCVHCCSIKPERAHHCSVCRRCIRKMDHHCPWIDNCVGEGNQKYFVLFTLYIFLCSAHALLLSGWHLFWCARASWSASDCAAFSPGVSVVLVIFLIVESVLFGLFTATMFYNQVDAIFNDETTVEALKKDALIPFKRRHGLWLSLKAVFGPSFSVGWLLPVAPDLNQLAYAWSDHV